MNDIFELHDVTAADLAFPAHVAHLMPKYEDIPQEFRRGRTIWNDLFSAWFYSGVKDLTLDRKDGVDDETAGKVMRQIRCIMGSYEPKHEHKEAAVAYIFSRFFNGYTLDGKEHVNAA